MQSDDNLQIIGRPSTDWSDRLRDCKVYDGLLVLLVAGISFVVHRSQSNQIGLMSLYFLPVTISGLYRGRIAAGWMCLSCIVGVMAARWSLLTPGEWLDLGAWGAILAIEGLIIGSLSEARRREMYQLAEMHRTDTLSDALTGVANRRAFEYELVRRITEWNRQRTSLSLMLLDIDHFKRLNDSYGHQAGDCVLQQVASVISENCRETDLVARYGGEEFVVVMPNTPSSEACHVAERVRQQIEAAEFEVGGLILRATTSIGLAQIRRGEERDDLLRRADLALYASKQFGRNSCHFHDGQNSELFGNATARSTALSPTVVMAHVDQYTDSLTGLPTRKVLMEELRRRLSENRRYAGDLSMMLIQVDDVSPGEVIDRELRRKVNGLVAECIRHVLRDVDLVARFDDDQFAVLMPRTKLEDALIPAERLRERVTQSRRLRHKAGELQVTISLGLASPVGNESAPTLIQRSQEALWSSVRSGGNRLCIHNGNSVESVRQQEIPLEPIPTSSPFVVRSEDPIGPAPCFEV